MIAPSANCAISSLAWKPPSAAQGTGLQLQFESFMHCMHVGSLAWGTSWAPNLWIEDASCSAHTRTREAFAPRRRTVSAATRILDVVMRVAVFNSSTHMIVLTRTRTGRCAATLNGTVSYLSAQRVATGQPQSTQVAPLPPQWP